MATKRRASIRNHLDVRRIEGRLEKIGIKITENLSNKQLRRIYLDNKKNSSDNVGSSAEQVDAAQTNDTSVNSNGLVNIGDTETIECPSVHPNPTWMHLSSELCCVDIPAGVPL